MSPKAIAVAGLSAIAIAASGCSGDSDAEVEALPATTTGQVETQTPAESAVNISAFRAEFEERFGSTGTETPWYGHVTGMKMAAHRTLEIATDVDPGDTETLEPICGAAMRFALNSEAGDGIEGVRVFDSDGAARGNCG